MVFYFLSCFIFCSFFILDYKSKIYLRFRTKNVSSTAIIPILSTKIYTFLILEHAKNTHFEIETRKPLTRRTISRELVLRAHFRYSPFRLLVAVISSIVYAAQWRLLAACRGTASRHIRY